MLVLSVPHTGTRFTCKLLESLGVIYRQYHTEPYNVDALRWESGRAVVPVRDPILCFCSTYLRGNPGDLTGILDRVTLSYTLMMQIEGWFDCHFLRLDASDKQQAVDDVARFCDAQAVKYKWGPVGNINDISTDYKMWNAVSKTIEQDKIAMVDRRLQDAREHYGY